MSDKVREGLLFLCFCYSEELGKPREIDLFVLEDVQLALHACSFAVHKEQTIRHDSKQTVLFRWQNVLLFFHVLSTLVHNHRYNVIESR